MTVVPYPWQELAQIPSQALASLSLARDAWARVVSPERLEEALSALVDDKVGIELGAFGVGPGEPRLEEVSFVTGQATIVVGVEPDLAVALLARVLGRPLALARPNEPLAASLAGALSALVVEVARRVSERPVTLVDPTARAAALSVEATVRLDGRAYRAYALVEGYEAPTRGTPPRVTISDLGELKLGVPLVVAASVLRSSELARLVPGSAFVPSEAWVDRTGHGRGILAAAGSERGVWVDLPPDGRIVLGQATAELSLDDHGSGESMADPNDVNETLTDAALDAPVVVRVELGVVSLAARAWATLKPGDVLQTGHPIGEPVLLRIAGRAVARGELVSVDGEVAVRVRELFGPAGET